MELERIIRDTLTCFIQSHIPAADLRYGEVQYHCFSLNSVLIVFLHIMLNSKWNIRALPYCFSLSQIQDAGNLHRLWYKSLTIFQH